MKNPPQSSVSPSGLTCIEICSGAGGQALGLERAGFEAMAHVEFDRHACHTGQVLHHNIFPPKIPSSLRA
jgi:DNA (cytosine-5)-methyltransferase 1